jgi:hypothetical protein
VPEWELVTRTLGLGDSELGRTERLRVAGGWLYRVVLKGSVATTFVPTPTTARPYGQNPKDL